MLTKVGRFYISKELVQDIHNRRVSRALLKVMSRVVVIECMESLCGTRYEYTAHSHDFQPFDTDTGLPPLYEFRVRQHTFNRKQHGQRGQEVVTFELECVKAGSACAISLASYDPHDFAEGVPHP